MLGWWWLCTDDAPPCYQQRASPPLRLAPRRLAAAAAAVARVLPRSLRPCNGGPPLELASRSRSMEVLSAGREQSAPYLPGKQPLAHAPPPTRQQAVARWRRACQAVIDAREVTRCLDLLGDRLAPAEDRLHASAQLALRLQAYSPPRQAGQALAWALLARRAGGGQKWGEHVVQELYLTGASPPSAGCCGSGVTQAACHAAALSRRRPPP